MLHRWLIGASVVCEKGPSRAADAPCTSSPDADASAIETARVMGARRTRTPGVETVAVHPPAPSGYPLGAV